MSNKPCIIPKPDSPYASLDFPDGIPVTYPIPIGMVDEKLLWDLDIPRTTDEQLLAIAQLVATSWRIHVDEVIAGIKQTKNFGIAHHNVARLVGKDATPDHLEACGRAFRAKMLLERHPTDIVLCLGLLDAVALYSELNHAVWILNSNDPTSETALLVGSWIECLPILIAPHAPELARVLIDKVEANCWLLPDLLGAINPNLQIDIPIPAYTAYLAIACLQLMSRNPNSRILDNIRHYIRTFSAGILQIVPEVNWLLERGWHPEFDGGGQ